MKIAYCAVLAALALSAVPVAAQRSGPDGTYWVDSTLHVDAERLEIAEKIIRNSDWYARYAGHRELEEAGLPCRDVRNNALDFLGGATIEFATQTPATEAEDYMEGEYFQNDYSILNVANSETMDWQAVIHEGQHHAGWGVGVTDTTELRKIEQLIETAIDCLSKVKKEEDDDDPDPNGGGDPLPPVCDDKLVAEYYTVYEREYRTGTVCLPWDSVGANWCSGVGKWVKVRKQKVRWVTQTVCSS